MSRLTELPDEIIFLFFSFAAASSRQTALELSLVSSWVKRSTAPHLYATVILRTFHQIDVFLRLLTLRPGTEEHNAKIHLPVNPGIYVRNICITYFAPHAWATHSGAVDPYSVIFKACEHTEKAALQSTFMHSNMLTHHAMQKPHIKELVVIGPTFPSDWEGHAEALGYVGGGQGVDLDDNIAGSAHNDLDTLHITPGASILQNVTHLRLTDPLSSPHHSGQHLTRLPRLTHLSLTIYEPIYSPMPFGELQPILDLRRIRAIVLCIDFDKWLDKSRSVDEWAGLAQSRDERLFVVQQRRTHHKQELGMWVETADGGEDIWSRALHEQERRRLRWAQQRE